MYRIKSVILLNVNGNVAENKFLGFSGIEIIKISVKNI